LPFIILLLAINKTRYNAFFVTGYEDLQNSLIDISPHFFIKLFQLFFSLDTGLFINNPILLISIFGICDFFRNHKIECITFLSIFSLYIIGLSFLVSYEGEWSWGSRLLLPVVSIFLIPAGYTLGITNVKKTIKLFFIPGIAVIITISFLIQLLSVLVQPQQYFSLKYNEFKKLGVEDKFIPGNLIGQFQLLRHKLTNKNEGYRLSEFGINSEKIIDQSRYETFNGLDGSFSGALRKLHACDFSRIANGNLRTRRPARPSYSGLTQAGL